MKLPYEWQIGLRYVRAGKRATGNGFISFIAAVSMTGIALGVASLIIVMSVMNGFKSEVRDRMLSVLAHIEIFSPTGMMSDWQRTANEALHHPSVGGAAPYVDSKALLTHGGKFTGVALRGIDPRLESQVSDIAKNMRTGRLDALVPGERGIVIGSALAAQLQVRIGEQLMFLAPRTPGRIGNSLPELKPLTVVGTFESGHYQYDSHLAFINIDDAQSLFHFAAPTGVRLRINDMQWAPQVASELTRSLSGNLHIRDWTQHNKTWFIAEQLQKRMLFMILVLIVAVAAFNLVSSLVMTVTQKQADIAILRTLGAQPRSIMKIFAIQGITIGFGGTLIGVALGCAIALSISWLLPAIEQILGIQFLAASVYFLSELPSKLVATDVLAVSAISALMSALATLYPSWYGAKIRPAQALRYE